VMRTPALVIDEKIVTEGKVPSSTEIKDIIVQQKKIHNQVNP